MKHFSNLKSINSKLTNLFFVLVLSSSGLFAQKNKQTYILPTFKIVYQKKHLVKTEVIAEKCKVYTVLLVKNFPTIEIARQTFNKIEEVEPSDFYLNYLHQAENETELTLRFTKVIKQVKS